MQNLIPTNAIENTIRVKFFGEPVLTTAQLAEFYGTSPNTIRKNFNANKSRFIDAKHYFRLTGENLQQFKSEVAEIYRAQKVNLCVAESNVVQNDITESNVVQDCLAKKFHLIAPKQNVLYLWTKRGAARHAKMLNTDRAWDVFELLEAAYFEKAAEKEKPLPEEKPPIENPPPLDFIRTCTLIGMATCARDPECFDKIARDAGYFIANGKFPDSSPQFKSLKEPIKLFYL